MREESKVKKWISSDTEGKKYNVLMLDLEQILVVDGIDFLDREYYRESWPDKFQEVCQPRNFSNYFIHRVSEMFDEVYLNTAVSERNAKKVVDEIWPNNFRYYDSFDRLKSTGYNGISKDVQVFHLEDGILNGNLEGDVLQMKMAGVHIFDLEPYNGYYSEKERIEEDGLKQVLLEMKENLVGKK